MFLKSLIIFLTIVTIHVGKSQASEESGIDALKKKVALLEKEILDLKMKNIVENKFEWQFLKMTEIENDIKKLHNRFEILENNYYRELKDLKSLVIQSDKSNSVDVKELSGNVKEDDDTKPLVDNSTSLDNLQSFGKEEELFMSAIRFFEEDELKLSEQRFSEFIEIFPTSLKLSSALFWRAEIRVKNENWIGAANDYLESFTINPNGEDAPKTLFGLGVSLGAIGEKDQACLTLDEIGSRFQDLEEALLKDISKAKNLLNCE